MQKASINSIQFSKALALLALLVVSGCTTVSQQAEDWRSNWPEREYYVEHYYTDPGNAAVQKQEDYLKWIKRFYNGWAFYPDGWDWLTNAVLAEVEDYPQRLRVKEKMFDLGQRISGEWAKNSDHRVINSRHLLIWADAVKKSVHAHQEERLADQVGADVTALLAGELKPSAIRLARYFPEDPEEIDPDDEFAFGDGY